MLEAYKIGVRVSLIDKVSGGLVFISRALLKTHGDAVKLQGALDSIKFKMAAGGAMLGAGVLGFAALKPLLDQAKELQEAQARFATFGLSPAANAEAIRFAMNMGIAGTSYVDAMNKMVEAQGVFRESGKLTLAEQLAGAKLAAPLLAKIAFSQAALGRGLPGGSDAAAKAMLRFVEIRGGLQSATAFNDIANRGFKAIQSSGGNVSWELYRQFMATGGTAAQGLTNDELFGRFEPIIGELKSAAGRALATSYNRVEGITRVPNQVAHLLVNSGIWRKNDVIWNSMGGIKQFADNKSPIVNHASFEQTPTLWYQNTLLPLYAKMGLDAAGRRRENAFIFGRYGGLEFNLIDRQLVAIMRSVPAQNKAKDINQTYAVAKNTAIGQQIILRKHLNDLEASAGSAILPMMVKGLETLNPMLWSLSTWTREHPGQVRALMYSFVGLSTALSFGGTATLLKGAFEGLRLVFPVLRASAIATTVAVDGPAGMVGALERGRIGVLGFAAAAAGIYLLYKNPPSGHFDKGKPQDLAHWHPAWTKGTWLDKSNADAQRKKIIGALFGVHPGSRNFTWDPAGATLPSTAVPHVSLTPWQPQQPARGYSAADLAAAVKSALSGVSVQMDRQVVGQLVFDHAGDVANRPSTGPGGWDSNLSPLRPDFAH